MSSPTIGSSTEIQNITTAAPQQFVRSEQLEKAYKIAYIVMNVFVALGAIAAVVGTGVAIGFLIAPITGYLVGSFWSPITASIGGLIGAAIGSIAFLVPLCMELHERRRFQRNPYYNHYEIL